jgi:large subunit ribosomal protein L18
MKAIKEKNARWQRRKTKIRSKISGESSKPRISVFKSNKYIYAQAIDDVAGITVTSASNIEKDNISLKSNVENAGKLGEILGKRLVEKNISEAVFDRNGYPYKGIVKALADGIRKAGVKF